MNVPRGSVLRGWFALELATGAFAAPAQAAMLSAPDRAEGSTAHPPATVIEQPRHAIGEHPSIVFLIGEDEYRTAETLPEFAKHELAPRGFKVTLLQENPNDRGNFPALVEVLPPADLLFISLRRRALPQGQMSVVRAHLEAGKPVVGIRTACHAFAPRDRDRDDFVLKAGRAEWPRFDPEVLGGNYVGHHGVGPFTTVRPAPGAESLPVLTAVSTTSFRSPGSLYRVSPLAASTTPLLIGSIPGQPPEPVAWINTYGPTRSRIFYTSLGHPDDFDQPMFRRLLVNGILWVLDRKGTPASPDPPR